jgi:branched-subunit amino acid ABC-type transport system permease component
MKFAFRAACVIALTYVYLRLIYLSDWLDAARKSPAGQKAYYFLANLVDVRNADDGETLLLWVYFVAALAAAAITVWAAYRFVVRPVRTRQRKTP